MLFLNKRISNAIYFFEPSKAKEGARVQGVQENLFKKMLCQKNIISE